MVEPLIFLTDCYGGRGGIAQYNRNLVRALSLIKEFKEITIFQRKVVYKQEKIPKKIKLIKNVSNSKLKFLIKSIYHLIFGKKYNLVFCCHIHLLPFAWAFSIKNRCPLVLVIFGEEAWKPTRHKISNYLCKKINYLISIRQYTAKKFLNWNKLSHLKYFFLPNCIDLLKYKNVIRNKKLEKKYKLKNKKIIISCARLDKEDKNKGIDEIIEILKDLSKKIRNLTYIVIGDGNDKKRLEIKSKSLKVDHIVQFLGNIDEKKKIEFYKLGHVMAMPGSRKTFDRYPYRFVNLEGLASGMHVLSSRLKYKSDLNDKNVKMLSQVNPNNKKKIIQKLILLLKKKNKISPNLKNFDFINFKRKIENFILKINFN
jgi:glycosyltransferase involved in cell wall biosynthesis